MALLGLHCCADFAVVAESGGPSLAVVHGLLRVVASLVAGRGLSSTGLGAEVYGFSCPAACEIFPDQGSNSCLLHRQADSSPFSHQGCPAVSPFKIGLACILPPDTQTFAELMWSIYVRV